MSKLRMLSHITAIREVLFLCLMAVIYVICGPEAQSQDYFQQEVNHVIHVTLDDKLHELNASAAIEYINNSPDTLVFLFFHLWPNAYSSNNTQLARQLLESKGRQRLFDDPELRGFMDSLDFQADGVMVKWNLMPESPDICRIFLNEPLTPGDTVNITTPFRVKIPGGTTSRLGHIGESYQITQWYPKPAVYDNSGWHPMPYLDQGEFYSEFGIFDVSITLPENYRVGATGNLQDEQEIEWLNMLAADTTWKRTMYYGGTRFPPSSERMKTIRYTGDQIHDFAWFADKRFHVAKGKVRLPGSGREVTTWVMFTNLQARLWQNAPEYVNSALWYFSNLIGDYPYDSYTAVQSTQGAGLGMEYPGITVIGYVKDSYSLDKIISHELAHSWFYSALGSNERRYPFMDESITSAYTRRYMGERYPGRKLWEAFLNNRKLAEILNIDTIPIKRLYELEWLGQARKNLEQPIDLPATDYNFSNYVHIIYNKGALGFEYLRAYLGDSIFDSAMQAYYLEWKHRHPRPEDLRAEIESHAGKDLSWFFADFTGTTKRLDYKIVRLNDQQVLVKNNAELASPLLIAGMTGDSIFFEQWVEGFKGQEWIDIPAGNYSKIQIDPRRIMPQISRGNSTIRTSGILPGVNPVKPRFLFAVEDPGKNTLVYLPLVNWNRHSGFMPGIALHNGLLVPKPTEFLFIPFYSIKNTSLIGFGQVSFNITPYKNFIRLATITLDGSRFGAPGDQIYHRARAGLDLYFRPGNIKDPLWQKVYGHYFAASDLYEITRMESAGMSSYLLFGYLLKKNSLINPYSMLASIETSRSYQKASVEFNYRFSYIGKDNGLDIRLFTGTMLRNAPKAPFHTFAPAGRSGREHYLYQGIYPDRFGLFTESFWSRQMTLSEGGLVSPVNKTLGYSDWLISLSLASSLPGKAGVMPVKPFATLLLNDRTLLSGSSSPFFYEAGLKAGIWDLFEIHVPLLVSDNIGSISGQLKDRIRIVLKLPVFRP